MPRRSFGGCTKHPPGFTFESETKRKRFQASTASPKPLQGMNSATLLPSEKKEHGGCKMGSTTADEPCFWPNQVAYKAICSASSAPPPPTAFRTPGISTSLSLFLGSLFRVGFQGKPTGKPLRHHCHIHRCPCWLFC